MKNIKYDYYSIFKKHRRCVMEKFKFEVQVLLYKLQYYYII